MGEKNHDCGSLSNTTQSLKRHKLEKLGINHLDGDIVFVAGDRLIPKSTAKDLKSEFSLETARFRLDIDMDLSPNQAFEGMRELICLSPEIGRVLVAHVISGLVRAAFKEAGFIPCAVLVVTGKSGMLKSHYVPQITQLYNRADGIRADSRFNSTLCFIEDIISAHDECTVVIDDLHTAAAKRIKRNNEITAEEILRRISDDTGRGHKEGNLTVQKKFGGNVVFIGEYVIGRESTMPRALVVNITKKIDGVILDKYQRKQPLLPSTFYYYFLQWYVDYFKEICEWIDVRLTDFRKATANSSIHGRLLDTLFYLQTSYMIFLEFCKQSEFISEEDALEEYDGFGNQLNKLILRQQYLYTTNEPRLEPINYLKLIRKFYKMGEFKLADNAAAFRLEIHDGLIHYNCLCLRREGLDKKLSQIIPHFDHDDCIKFLVNGGMLKRIQEKNTVQVNGTGGKRFYAIRLDFLE